MPLRCEPFTCVQSKGFAEELFGDMGRFRRVVGRSVRQTLRDANEVLTDGGGGRKNEVLTDFCPEGIVRSHFRGKGA